MNHKLLPLTETMHYILLVLRKANHGYAVMQEIQRLSHNTVILAPGTLYGAIENLSKNGLIEHVGTENRKKVYLITPLGEEILEIEKQRLEHIINLY
ncbi:helix-turn-helix transcriptional regulator [Facklamia sp. DSM 111018]|uniref:Helix-turn-helix transcriptional regulator n=1 Tax=Facklamia lactis TaxID=2749967 RepID=A0ABS0LQF8_9LACT|nr:helix-turn-helix transcriptional regulator [Facklamia lactis]MBG9979714.1 helix-turn-helix transcriptional regulator [Facklamia lactis]MBG9985606.1 helix-turn-helix transcriptional regulator [Facklamia lactis]